MYKVFISERLFLNDGASLNEFYLYSYVPLLGISVL